MEGRGDLSPNVIMAEVVRGLGICEWHSGTQGEHRGLQRRPQIHSRSMHLAAGRQFASTLF